MQVKLLAFTIWTITTVTVVLFAGKYWWFPESASTHGESVDRQFMYTLWVTGAVFIVAQVALGYLLVRYRERPGRKAIYNHGNDKMELTWTLATTVLFYVMVIAGQGIWYSLYIEAAPQNALQIEVTGQQFAWNIRYAGPDGEFGPVSPDLINDSAGNPLGLDLQNSAAQDDLVVPTMAIPINRPIELLLRSKDVTHAFSVRELRIKQDTVPGLVIPIQFTANRTGRFEISCAELCGLGHHRMRSFIEVLSEEDYSNWLVEQSEY